MKKFAAILGVLALASVASADLIISEIVDATLPGGLPKWVEITNTGGASVDMSQYYIGNINNGDPDSGFSATQLSGTLAAGDSYVVSYENSDGPGVGMFFDTYGFDADNHDPGSWINGDDVVALYFGDPGVPHDGSTAVDIYGVVGVDGTGENWEYTDGYSYRLPNYISGQNPFVEAEWFFGGANSLETGDDVTELALILANTTPGTHNFIPEPASLLLIGLAGLVLRRR